MTSIAVWKLLVAVAVIGCCLSASLAVGRKKKVQWTVPATVRKGACTLSNGLRVKAHASRYLSFLNGTCTRVTCLAKTKRVKFVQRKKPCHYEANSTAAGCKAVEGVLKHRCCQLGSTCKRVAVG
ncbi:uncharacterized protein LOC135400327 [Ornithodoros turicata]|uniref:uncharacterized protein LOC135400327 n=1 Tax=Ornithodoros turicata TaxID=34597 RepID=UPI00313977A5